MLLLIDNYDSFTYNLVHYLSELGAEIKVVRNDALSVDDVLRADMKGIVLSPGPCDPDRAGICLELVRRIENKCPVLGVCLGHQTIGQVFGGDVIRAPEPVHGKTSMVYHTNKGIFKDIPSPFEATRYHSLIVKRETFPDVLEITAETKDGIIMGLAHKTYPIHGVQFHPESIASQHGHALLKNFLEICGSVRA